MESVNKIEERHEIACDGKLEVFTLLCGSMIHVELHCKKCNRRWVAEIYNLTEV